MEDVVATRSAVPPPLPPKTRRPPPPTSFSFPEMSSVKLVSSAQHVVKIRINPEQDIVAPSEDGCIRISVKPDSPYFFYSGQSSPSDTLDSGTCSDLDGSPPPPLPKKTSVAVMGAPVTSPVSTPGKITVTVNGGGAELGGGYHQRTGSLTSSGAEVDTEEEDDDRISCDSLNSHDADSGVSCDKIAPEPDPPVSMAPPPQSAGGSLPQGLLHDIRERSAKLVAAADAAVSKIKAKPSSAPAIVTVEKKPEEPPRPLEKPLPKTPSPTPPPTPQRKSPIVEERTYEDRRREWDDKQQQLARDAAASQFVRGASFKYEDDRFYSFHLNESASSDDGQTSPPSTVKQPRRVHEDAPGDEEDFQDDVATFAGVRGIGDVSTIRSSKGTVRGVRNRVRAGIATFLQNHDTKNYKEKEAGKVVVYTTTMGVVRETHQACLKVRNILRTLLVRYEERDVFMSRETQAELRERMRTADIVVPQVFVEGVHIGDAEIIERLNETGELRKMMKPFKDPSVCHTCQVCGGFRLLPCSVCNGSKKSIHRNDFTSEFVALKCMHCDEVGLVRCYACS